MTTLSRWAPVQPALRADPPALAALIDGLERELRDEADRKGAMVVDVQARMTGSVPMSHELPRSVWRRLLRLPAVTVIDAPVDAVLVEARLLEIISHELPVSAQLIADDAPADSRIRAAVIPHLHCGPAGTVATLQGTVDVGGYRSLRCPEHGEVWVRGG